MNTFSPGSEKTKAREAVFRLLKLRPRSEQELRQKLEKNKFSDETVKQTIQYLKHTKAIDDRRFTRAWINSRLARPFGLTRIRFELKLKGISDQIIHEELHQAKETFVESETILALAQRRINKYKNIEKLKAKRRTYEYLIRRGFSSEAINQAIRKL